MGAVLGRICNDYESLIEICRQRADELAISREGIDVVIRLRSRPGWKNSRPSASEKIGTHDAKTHAAGARPETISN